VARTFFAGLLAIALFFAGSVAFVWYVTAPVTLTPSPGTAPGPEATAIEAPASEPGEPAAVRGFAGIATAAGPAARAGERAPASVRRTRSSFRRELIAGLATLQKQAAKCASGNAAAGRAALADTGFTLALETIAGGIRVADVRLESRGTASETDVACVRAALRGEVVPAASAEPGRTLTLPFSVSQGS
jgi:hypothetical protein